MYNIIKYEKRFEKQVIDLILKIFCDEFGYEKGEEGYRKVNFEKDFEDNGGAFWIAIENDTVIGTIGVKRKFENDAELTTMYVSSEYRGKGISQQLFDVMLNFVKEINYDNMYLGTYKNMQRAIKFYEKNGFKESEENKTDEENAVFYKLKLK